MIKRPERWLFNMKTIQGPFRKQLASDVNRDGLGVELLSGDDVVAEVFRRDADHSLIITTFNNDVPLVVIEEFIAAAQDRLHTFEDGTSLPVYVSPVA